MHHQPPRKGDLTGAVSCALLTILICSSFLASVSGARAQSPTLVFAAIGDYGTNNASEAAVAAMVTGWNPDLVVSLGDNYYTEAGGSGTAAYDLSVGKYYCNFLKDITTTGTFCPTGTASINKFFPALGDHDYDDAGTTDNLPSTYMEYFTLPGQGYSSSSNNERYYDFVAGPVHFFVLNSLNQTGREPDGTSSTSIQAQWLKTQMGASTSTWNIVIVHNPPYSSGAKHGSTPRMQWPFAQWGADAVLSGDDHIYERIHRDGVVYFVNGLGGGWPYGIGTPVEGSSFRFAGTHGAQRIIATGTSLTFEFLSVQDGGTLLDSYTITTPHPTSTPTLPVISSGWLGPSRHVPVSGTGDGNGYEVNPTFAFADDGLFAMDLDSGTSTSTSCTDQGKDRHRFLDFNLSIPGGAIVQGIEVRLDAKADSLAGAPKICAALSWNNAVTWSGWKNTAQLTIDESTYILGGPRDDWGRNWTVPELSNAAFQVRVANVAGDLERDFMLEWIAVNVSYSPGPMATSVITSAIEPPSPTAANTSTDTHTASITPTPSSTATLAATNRADFTDTVTSTTTATFTLTSTSVPSTATLAPTHTPMLTATAQPSNTPAATATKTSTPVPAPPGKVTLTAPLGLTASNRPLYTWNADALATWYYLWVNGPSGNVIQGWHSASAVCREGVCSTSPPVTLQPGSHTWWVRSWNPYGYGPWSAGMSFSIPVPRPPTAATLMATQESLIAGQPTYVWNEAAASPQADAATWYYLWVNGPSGNVIKHWYSVSAACNDGICSVAPNVTLRAGAYTWWVRTWNNAGYGPWSSSKTLTILP